MITFSEIEQIVHLLTSGQFKRLSYLGVYG